MGKVQSSVNKSPFTMKVALCIDISDLSIQSLRSYFQGFYTEKHQIELIQLNGKSYCSKGDKSSKGHNYTTNGMLPKLFHDSQELIAAGEQLISQMREEYPAFTNEISIQVCQCKSLSPKNVMEQIVETLDNMEVKPKKIMFGARGYIRLRSVLNDIDGFKRQALLVKNVDCIYCQVPSSRVGATEVNRRSRRRMTAR